MAEAIAVAASVIAILQISDRIIGICKFYLGDVQDAPSDLRVILIEISMVKTIFESLQFLNSCKSGVSDTVQGLTAQDGPIEGCHRAVTDLEKLFPSDCLQGKGRVKSKKRKVEATLAALAWPLKATKARKLLVEVARYKTTITLALTTEATKDIKDIQSRTVKMHDMLTESQRQEVYKWLPRTDPSPLHNQACSQYEIGTGSWMLRSPVWKYWLEGKNRCLWIHGIPGAGKTFLMSYLIGQIEQHCGHTPSTKRAYAYYYCYFGHGQDEGAPFLRWLLSQLCRQADTIPSSVYQLYKEGVEPSIPRLLNGLEEILSHFEIAYVVIDAIDESNPRDNLLKVLRDLATDSRFRKLQLLAASREYIDIERVMEQFSVAVSMANPAVEDDIKLHVRSTLHLNPKFKCWPEPLLLEVENALATGARGMFRWAVCQIDVLRRLKPEHHIIENTLRNLPKTLDETYERIFLSIPEDDRPFVHHALQWIYYHNTVHEVRGHYAIECSTLLRAIAESTAKAKSCHDDHFYDEETLQELCGCLIRTELRTNLTNVGKSTVHITFAHYTVREYIDSTRISNSPIAYFTTRMESVRQMCAEIVMSEVIRNQSSEKMASDTLLSARDVSFFKYCALSTKLALHRFVFKILQLNKLFALAVEILDPSKPHFEVLWKSVEDLGNMLITFHFRNPDALGHFRVSCLLPRGSVCTSHLLHLLHFSEYTNNLELLERFLLGNDAKGSLKAHLHCGPTRISGLEIARGTYDISAIIIEIFAQFATGRQCQLKLLLELGSGMFSPSEILVLFIGSHDHDSECDSTQYCPLKHLLELGGDPNEGGHQITPLQIAVHCWDYAGVGMLLEAKADPNSVGSRNGIAWHQRAPLSRFNRLRNASPLAILKIFGCIDKDSRMNKREGDALKIERILIEYGAKEFTGAESEGEREEQQPQMIPSTNLPGTDNLFNLFNSDK